MRKYNSRSADSCESLAVLDNACSDSGSSVVACASDYDSPLAETEFVRHTLCERTRDLARFVDLSEPVLVNFKRGEQLVRPLSVRHIEKLHTRGIADLSRVLVGEHEAEEILREQNVRDLAVNFRLVVLYPENFCGSPAGQRGICRYFNKLFTSHDFVHLLNFSGSSLVAPDN